MKRKVTVTKLSCLKGDGWCSFRAEDDNRISYHFCGILPDVKEGNLYEIEAEETNGPYGVQYKIQSAVKLTKEDRDSIYKYLTSGFIQGIGDATAKKIMDAFGMDTLRVIREEPDRLLEVKGISRAKLEKIVRSAKDNRDIEGIYLYTKGAVTKLQAKALLQKYRKKTLEVLKANPYEAVMALPGMGFLKADKIAMGTGIACDCYLRMRSAILYVLENVITANGSCYATMDEMQQETLELLAPFPVSLEKLKGFKKKALEAAAEEDEAALKHLAAAFKLTVRQSQELNLWMEDRRKYLIAIADSIILMSSTENPEICCDVEKERIASSRIHSMESYIADTVLTMLKAENGYADEMSADSYIMETEAKALPYSGEQKEALFQMLSSRLSIVTGGPGCGKTTVISLLAGYWESMGGTVQVLTPTGRAAKRVEESMAERLPGNHIRTSTVDRLLADVKKLEKEAEENQATPERDTEKELIICDESSMADIILAARLFKYAKDARLVLVGDPDQLPPVGAGNVFLDLIGCGRVPVVRLTKNYRSTGNIIENAVKIRNGSTKLKTGPDFSMVSLDRSQIADRIVEEYRKFLNIPDVTIKDICVLSPQRQKGAASVKLLNEKIREACNPARSGEVSYEKDGLSFRTGDRVVHKKNDYEMLRIKGGEKSHGVFNGDLGIVEEINREFFEEKEPSVPDTVQAELQDPDQDDPAAQEPWVLRVRFDDGSAAEYRETDLLSLEHAFAMTVHKAQGCEFRFVIATFAMDQFVMLSRPIVYTALTRAKEKNCVVYERKALFVAIRNQDQAVRNTFLKELLG